MTLYTGLEASRLGVIASKFGCFLCICCNSVWCDFCVCISLFICSCTEVFYIQEELYIYDYTFCDMYLLFYRKGVYFMRIQSVGDSTRLWFYKGRSGFQG